MKKLVLYSDQVVEENYEMDIELLKLIGKRHVKAAYVPSESEPMRQQYWKKYEYYRKYGINELLYCDLDCEYDERIAKELLDCDLIHLSGGITGRFLNSIRKRDFSKTIYEFLRHGGVLAGVSAGSILMSKDIYICSVYPYEYELDEITDYRSLKLTNFDFYPHYDYSEYVTKAIEEFSLRNPERHIYACPDGSGIIINGEEIKHVGHMLVFRAGAITDVNG